MLTQACVLIQLAVATPPDALDDALVVLNELDATRLTVQLDDAPASEALASVGRMLSATVRADWPALTRLGVYPDTPVTLHLVDARASSALAALTAQLGDDFDRPRYEAHAGQIVLTTTEGVSDMALPAIYDVRDLLVPQAAAAVEAKLTPPVPADEQPPIEESKGEDMPADDDEEMPDNAGSPPPVRILSPAERIMSLILDHVDPESWLDYGGSQARVSAVNDTLLVTAPPTVHRGVRNVLRQLRSGNSTSITLDAAIIDLPRTDLNGITRRHPARSAALASALMHSGIGDELWFTHTNVAIDEVMRSTADTAGVSITVEILPTIDSTTGQLKFALEAMTIADDDSRSLQTTIVLTALDQAALVELPEAGSTDTARVLVLRPVRN